MNDDKPHILSDPSGVWSWLAPSLTVGGLILLVVVTLFAAVILHRYRKLRIAHRRLVQSNQEHKDSFRDLVEMAQEGIAVVQDKRLVYMNPRMCEMTGYTEDELKALPTFLPLIAPSVRDIMLANHLRRVAGEITHDRYESLFLRKDGTSYPIELSGVAITWEGRPAMLKMVTDISERKVVEEEMQHLALHDSLTDLPNRHMLQGHLDQAIALAQRTGVPLAVLFMDLNGFKWVNDTHGHEVGDGLLQEVARRIRELLRGSDIMARMGGDEFVILLPQVESRKSVEQVVERIHAALRAPIQVRGHELHCSTSLGMAMYPDEATSATGLLSRADHMMYAEKRRFYQYKLQSGQHERQGGEHNDRGGEPGDRDDASL